VFGRRRLSLSGLATARLGNVLPPVQARVLAERAKVLHRHLEAKGPSDSILGRRRTREGRRLPPAAPAQLRASSSAVSRGGGGVAERGELSAHDRQTFKESADAWNMYEKVSAAAEGKRKEGMAAAAA
jgi:hypothetical protein